MKKMSIIYWSNGGNVEVLANKIKEGAESSNAKVNIKLVSEAKVQEVIDSDVVAFGSPSMDNNKIEQLEMEPFINEFKMLPVNGKKVVLFGSYGWDNGQFMEEWKEKMIDYGFHVVDTLVVRESPNEEQMNRAYELGKSLANI
ncbi:flavodoxin [Haloimpatiens lingqiaonensis]|uniref:flavodoxin n=1 Tax=Haloimpatiens lingqiaonensis TaxID=1380675 RepID=UPI0010FE71D0|nr:flavodoxin [Haloimpatiens lingqiaonensis]